MTRSLSDVLKAASARPYAVSPGQGNHGRFMKTLILYGSPIKLTRAHKLVSNPKQPKYYVRAKLTFWGICAALDKAKAMPGETVLNTVEV